MTIEDPSSILNSKNSYKRTANFFSNSVRSLQDPKQPQTHTLTNLELPLVLIDRALEAKSKSFAPRNAPETKIGTDFKDEAFEKLSELLGSVKSVIEVVSNGDRKLVSNSLEQSNKERKDAPE